MENLRPLWERALRESGGTMFQGFEWNLLALRVFSDQAPHIIAAEKDSSIAILPLVVHDRTLTLAGSPLFDYRDGICAGDSAAFDAALEAAGNFRLPLSVAGVHGRAAAGRWSRLSPQAWTAAPYISAGRITADEFVAKHARGRRALRRVSELGAQVRTMKGTAEAVERIYREKAKEPASWGINVFQDERCIEFMRAVVGLPNTRCELFLLEVAEEPIAALVTFADGQVRRFYTTWMNPTWGKHSPGIALLFEATRLTLAEGLDCDYMTGEQPYKLRFATGSAPLYKIEASAEQLAALSKETEQPVALIAA